MNIFDLIAHFKLYLARTSGYLGIINFMLILLTFKATYKINVPSIIVIPICLIFAILIGWIDYVLIMPKEIIWNNKQNDIKHQIDRIEKDLKKLLENKK